MSWFAIARRLPSEPDTRGEGVVGTEGDPHGTRYRRDTRGWLVAPSIVELGRRLEGPEGGTIPRPGAMRVLYCDGRPWSLATRIDGTWAYLVPGGRTGDLTVPRRTEFRQYTLTVEGLGTHTGRVAVTFDQIQLRGGLVAEMWRSMGDGSPIASAGGMCSDPDVPARMAVPDTLSQGFAGVLTEGELERAVHLLGSAGMYSGYCDMGGQDLGFVPSGLRPQATDQPSDPSADPPSDDGPEAPAFSRDTRGRWRGLVEPVTAVPPRPGRLGLGRLRVPRRTWEEREVARLPSEPDRVAVVEEPSCTSVHQNRRRRGTAPTTADKYVDDVTRHDGEAGDRRPPSDPSPHPREGDGTGTEQKENGTQESNGDTVI